MKKSVKAAWTATGVTGLALSAAFLASSLPASANVVAVTSPVSAGPAAHGQQYPDGPSSVDGSPMERCRRGTDYTVPSRNPVLDESLTTSFKSNVGLSVKVQLEGGTYYGSRKLIFTNTSNAPVHTDCLVLKFRAPSGSVDHHYRASVQYGHPQQDYVEVPRGNGESHYVIRLGFHDVPLADRTIPVGQTWVYELAGSNQGSMSLEATRDSVEVVADMNVGGNTWISRYGTKRLGN
ncbi:hypothetical protein F4560_001867 [Saccharothrix ecbatanensis]|uniref:Secreted protein n=1 Tax=Saccharothrix ecbatanensis TaxID=1105145 RepID=A0A7W9HH09_9PSEU|nr:hypothetical protein [Saccharothrix ecbatanensis]MBB5802099.1 hypothetical protein [Saccharothrix ecbatanensis]